MTLQGQIQQGPALPAIVIRRDIQYEFENLGRDIARPGPVRYNFTQPDILVTERLHSPAHGFDRASPLGRRT